MFGSSQTSFFVCLCKIIFFLVSDQVAKFDVYRSGTILSVLDEGGAGYAKTFC